MQVKHEIDHLVGIRELDGTGNGNDFVFIGNADTTKHDRYLSIAIRK